MKHFLFLLVAIFFEIIGTTSIQSSQQFTRLKPSILVVVCFSLTFFFFSHSLKGIPLGIAYAIWSGIGIVAISLVGFFYFKQSLDWPAIIGIIFILVGVLIIRLYSKTVV
jgi:small multidrug resistance pump